MAKPRLPQSKAEVSGAAIVNPGRFADRKGPRSARPIGEPYSSMTEGQKEVWREMAGDMPWLNSGHRILLRLACYHAAQLFAGEDIGATASKTLSSILSKLGATPVDETKVNHGDDGDEDPSDRFFSRPN